MSSVKIVKFAQNEYINLLKDYVKEIDRFSLNQYCMLFINIKNIEQIKSMLSSEYYQYVLDSIFGIIKSRIEAELTDHAIFYNEKFYYCILKNNDNYHIENISYDMHKNLLSESFMSIFADSRFVALRISPEIDIEDYVNIISDQQYYSDRMKIFTWLENPKIILQNLFDEYQMLGLLRNAINSKSACFAFQPIVSSQSGKISYHECLLRLSDLHHELISAGGYIQLAEKYGYIPLIDEYVLDMVIMELVYAKDIKLSVNISNIGIQSDAIIRKMNHLLGKYDVGNRLIIEITETAVNNDFDQTKKFIDEAKLNGCLVAIDDFGVGYTSLNQIRKLPIDIVKIDGSFIRDITTNNKSRVFVENLIRTASDLNCKTVAEFVESGEIAKILIDVEVDFMQGNFFSPALNYRTWKRSK